jgi:hypothetical protein
VARAEAHLSDLITGQNGAHRESVGQSLCEGHDVGFNSESLMREKRAAPTHAGLDLIQHYQDIVFTAEPCSFCKEITAHGMNAALTLYRFEEYGAGTRQPFFKRFDVAYFYVLESPRVRGIGLDMVFGIRNRERLHRPAVESAVEAYYPVPVWTVFVIRSFPRKLDSRFGGFGAAVTEKDSVHFSNRGQLPGKFRLDVRVVPVGYMHEPAGLFTDGFNHLGVAVPQVTCRDPSYKIRVFIAIPIPHPGSLAPGKHYGKPSVIREKGILRGRDDFFG